jgi:hypothetical protein
MALGQATTTTIDKLLKIRYPQSKIHEMAYKNAALLGTIKKDKKFGGKKTSITVNYGRSQGSASFAKALANVTSDDDVAFEVTRVRDYHIMKMSSEAIEASQDNASALAKAFDRAHKNGLMSFGRSISQAIYRNGGGARGRISSGSSVATATVTLDEPEDVVHFEVNLVVQASANDGTSGALRNSGAEERIVKVNRTDGTITCNSAAWNTTISAIATGDYLFRSGDFGALISGLAAWLPTTAPTGGDNFFGVDRSADPTRLAGQRYTASAGQSKEDAIFDCATRLAREGGDADKCLMNPVDFGAIAKSLQGHATYEQTKSTEANVFYDSIKIATPAGKLSLMHDPNCPKGRFYMLQSDTWTLGSLKEVPHVVQDDGKMLERQSDSDGVMWRVRMYGNVYCEAPGLNAVGVFA